MSMFPSHYGCVECHVEIDCNQFYHRSSLCMDCEWKRENPPCTQQEYNDYEKFCLQVISQAIQNLATGIINASDLARMQDECNRNLERLKCRLEQKPPKEWISQEEYMKGDVA